MKRQTLLGVAFLLSAYTNIFAQSSASFAIWKYDRPSAYSLTMDDFGLATANGIEDYADTICANRNIQMSFGAIIQDCNAADWARANQMIANGHEIMNHSWTHRCGNAAAGPWCQAFGVWDADDFWLELDSSSNVIEQQTGVYPRIFIYPFDQFVDTMNGYLRALDYLGTRSGTYDGTNAENVADPFQFAFWVYRDTSTPPELNAKVEEVLITGGWAVREVHGVQDGSWGSIPEADFREHIDTLKSKVDQELLWVGTPSDVISYINQRNAFDVTTIDNIPLNEIDVVFSQTSAIKTHILSSPVTVMVDVTGMTGPYNVFQGGVPVNGVRINGNIYSFEVYPHLGNVKLTGQTCPGNEICIATQPIPQVLNEGMNATFNCFATSTVTPISYQWYKDNILIPGATDSIYSILGVVATDQGLYTCQLNNGVATANSDTVMLTVNAQTPYGGTPHIIPGTIQAEDYDNGGQGMAYNDLTPGNTPGNYRSDDVDIEPCSDVGAGFNLSYTQTGEWLEYTVIVATTGNYDFEFRVASDDFGTKEISADMDGSDITGNVTVPFTNGWQNWTTVNANGIALTAGQHVIRLNITGIYNLNYVRTTTTATDCHGDPGGSAYMDNCSTCVGGNTGLPACTQDCHGDWGGTAYIDSCSTCVGGNTSLTPCTQDCNSEWGGTAYFDSCATCVGGSTGLSACTRDCNNEWGGTAIIDSCGQCTGGSTGLTPELDPLNCITGGTKSTDSDKVAIYPNPFSGRIHVAGASNSIIEIVNATGQVVFRSTIASNNVAFKVDLPSGVYIVNISGNSNSVTKRLISE